MSATPTHHLDNIDPETVRDEVTRALSAEATPNELAATISQVTRAIAKAKLTPTHWVEYQRYRIVERYSVRTRIVTDWGTFEVDVQL